MSAAWVDQSVPADLGDQQWKPTPSAVQLAVSGRRTRHDTSMHANKLRGPGVAWRGQPDRREPK
jgi:hypothetical protein